MEEEQNPVVKTPLKAKVIKAIGGKPNGTGDTWVFTTGQIKKIAWAVGLFISFAFTFGSRLDKYARLPDEMRCLAEAQAQANKAIADVKANAAKEHDDLKKEDALQKQLSDNMREDMKNLLVDVRFIREQLERRK